MEGQDCVSLDVLRQYPGHEPSDIDCSGSSHLKRYCDLTLIEDITIWCNVVYMNGSSRSDKESDKAKILVQSMISLMYQI